MASHWLDIVFNPRSVAVLGANDNPSSVAGRVFLNLLQDGFKGTVIPVNPKHDQVAGHKCYASLADIDQAIDLAVIATPAKTVPDIITQCGMKNIKSAIVLSAGFGEMGDSGKSLETQLINAARHANVRFIGPNCLGVMRPRLAFNATFLDKSAPVGRLALVSQSGALCAAIVDWARPNNLGFATIVSMGNSTDVGFGDVLDYLAMDPTVDAILLYVEGIADARTFMSGLRSAARVKPVIVLKSGRFEHSSKAASTHTGALIGSDDVFGAALERAGVVRAMTFGQLFAAAEMLSANKRVQGKRLAIITNGGGAGVLATDRAEELRITVPKLDDKTVAALSAFLPAHWSHANPVDILGDAGPEKYAEAIKVVMADPNIDGILVMLTPQAMTDPGATADAIIAAAGGQNAKPVLACFMGEERVAEAREKFARAGIPDFSTPERAVEAFSYLARFKINQDQLLQVPGPFSDDRKLPDVDGARMIIETVLQEGRTMLNDRESKAVLSAFRISCTPTLAARSFAEALTIAETIGFPLVMKIASPQISHKSDVDGVRAGINNSQQVHAAWEQLVANARAARPDAVIEGVTIEPMVSGRDKRELLVGVKNDPVFGPVISFGSGGTMAEVVRDSWVSLPPLNRVLAARQISRTRIAQALGEFRNLPPVDMAALEDVLLRISELVCELPHISELDINPLFAGKDGTIAVDARISVHRPVISPEPYGHMAIHPYPANLTTSSYLQDGSELIIRPIMPEDAEYLQSFFKALSPEAKYFRFMQRFEELSPQMLMRFTQIDYSREMALVALVKEAGVTKQIGVARYVINPDGKTCEFAIAVSDEKQKQGIGSQLMQKLLDIARKRGLTMMEGAVLANNTRMLGLMKALNFTIQTASYDPSIKQVEYWF